MTPTPGRISDDNPKLGDLATHVALAGLAPPGSEPHRLARELRDLPTLPDRFNDAFIDTGWIFVEFACGYEAAEQALKMRTSPATSEEIDLFLAANLLAVQPIRWQALKLLGGGMAEPYFPVRAEVTNRALDAYDCGDHLVSVPLILMLVDGFGVSTTGTKSMFSDLADLNELFQSSESIAGHPTALKPLLERLRRSQRGYSEDALSLPMRNGILHGTRLNYANSVVAAKALNLLAAVVEWARDIAPEPKEGRSRKEWNARFLTANLERLAPDTPERALELLVDALKSRRPTDAVALIDYHPSHTDLSTKIEDWREFDEIEVAIERISPWEVFGEDRPGQTAHCEAKLILRSKNGVELVTTQRIYAGRSPELVALGLPAYWQIALTLLGAIRSNLSNG